MSAARRRAKREPRPAAIGVGWRTSDEDEIERRRRRAAEETIRVQALERGQPFFGAFAAGVPDGEAYRVEIRALDEPVNSCECPDYAINGLGTCKHVEAVQRALARRRGRGAAAREGSRRVEIFLDRRDDRVRVRWPAGERRSSGARRLLDPFFASDGTLLADPLDAWPALARVVAAAPARTRARIRLSGHVEPWLAALRRRREGARARAAFEADVAAGKQSLELVKAPLYPYQREGMLHLAFTGRALLADEMGLGKTVQAIAACALLRRLRGVERVLVVSPASLKGEWEDQIARFTDLPSLLVQGPRAARLRQYREPAFFHLASYEQVLVDRHEMNDLLAPDVVVLDEAQRIKNWQSKTAREVKRLASPYAFVLTGTPLENRIDELYSIVQMLDPQLLGPLFRFNREFYRLDERGRPIGYRNLDELHRRVRPVMLRRRKEEVEGELPTRTVNTYFVPMHEEQRARYAEYEGHVARLAQRARRRPLTPEEWERLQQWLACMRMLCDTPYILDPDCRVAPKLDELEAVLSELAQTDRKAIVFSEWVRMLELVAGRVEALGLGFVRHTGEVPQRERREAVRRFQRDADCRVLLSSDSGSLGLNLQAASVVVNVDLPWNPARLEQRIARAWRKRQTRPVQVVNLVSEDTIEHRMLDLLDQKRALAASVVDGAAGATEMALPSGRKAMLERVQRLFAVPSTAAPARGRAAERHSTREDRLREDVLGRLAGRVHRLEIVADGAAGTRVLAVLDRIDETARSAVVAHAAEHLGAAPGDVEVLDAATWAAIERLIGSGLLAPGAPARNVLHAASGDTGAGEVRRRRRAAARRALQAAERKQRMAEVLAAGGFAVEAFDPLREAVEGTLRALARLEGESGDAPVPIESVAAVLGSAGLASDGTAALVEQLRERGPPADEEAAQRLLAAGAGIVRAASEALGGSAPE